MMSFLSPQRLRASLLPVAALLCLLALWYVLTLHPGPVKIFPTPGEVWVAFLAEKASGRLVEDTRSSLMRVGIAYTLAVVLGVPVGIFLGQLAVARQALLPLVNFLRSVSPISWIPFAIQWFGIGDKPVIFLVFAATFPTVTLGTLAAVMAIPQIYFRVARDYGLHGVARLLSVTVPAVLPEVLTTLRVAMGLAWIVVVAAEMVSRSTGLGFLIQDARNNLSLDIALVGILLIGLIGIVMDRLLMLLTRLPAVRWGYER